MSKNTFVLEFEKPLFALLNEINKLEEATDKEKYSDLIEGLKKQFHDLRERIFSNLTAHQRLQIARHPERPYTLNFVKELGQNWIQLHGNRTGDDDSAIIGGLLELEPDYTVMIVGTEKGRDIKEKQKRNFGMPQPSGYQKALRLFKHAEKFNIPIITLIDTPGAYPGLEAEAHGQSGAIAKNIQEMANITVPIITVITGEGGSGGALALGVANKVLMFENSVYSVISPEGCAAILWRTRDKAADAANALKITASDLLEIGLIDEVIPEAVGGAHSDYIKTASNLKTSLKKHLTSLEKMSPEELRKERILKFRNYGIFTQ